MKKATFLFSISAGAVLLVGSPTIKAEGLLLSTVAPLSSFSFDVIGFNLASSAAYYVAPPETATFGATSTFTAVGADGQNITISSSEAVGVTTTTDTFTVSTPTNFITDASIGGNTINALQFDLGDSNSGGTAVSVLTPITTYTATGSTIYGTNTTAAVGTNTMLGTGGMSYAAAEGVNTSSGDPATAPAINAYAVHSFTYSITYANLVVPEPSTWAMLGFGVILGVVATLRRCLRA